MLAATALTEGGTSSEVGGIPNHLFQIWRNDRCNLSSQMTPTQHCRASLYLGTSLGPSLANSACPLFLLPDHLFRDAVERKYVISPVHLETDVPGLGLIRKCFLLPTPFLFYQFSHIVPKTLGQALLTFYYHNKQNYRGENKGSWPPSLLYINMKGCIMHQNWN